MKKVGILYDNISGNMGDQAVGISVRKMLAEMGVDYEELIPGRFNTADYRTIIIGGGYLLQPSPNFFYDKFRVTGKQILNCCGILRNPDDLQYLDDYLYVTVRSSGDRDKLSYLTGEVKVVPCTTMLLKDLPHLDLRIQKPSIGVHVRKGAGDEDALVDYLSKQPCHVYFLPITYHHHDFTYMERLNQKLPNSTLLPIMRPEEVHTVIGQFGYFICMSLHGAIFAYAHNVPFLLYESHDKHRFFMEDRRLDNYLVKSPNELQTRFEELLNSRPDYSALLDHDFKTLREHKLRIQDILLKQTPIRGIEPVVTQRTSQAEEQRAIVQQRNFQVNYLQSQVEALAVQAKQHVARINYLEANLRAKVSQARRLESDMNRLQSQLFQIQHSIPMQLADRYKRSVAKLLPAGTRRYGYYELALRAVWVILNEGWRSFFRKAWGLLTHRPASIRRPRRDLPRFNSSMSAREADEIVFPVPSDRPDVSILIPAYNQLTYTLNCLKSVSENTDGDYEVVVIDDASTDGTGKALSRIKNIQLITNERNEGFLESCNRGARASKGKYILFLNNDTLVTKGWLPPLLELMKREDVGAVGSMLLYPDGTLQEAGSMVWNDGSARNYGRGDDPDKPEYNYVREVDYCPGASALVRRGLFEEVGGFDERYKPAYKEIVDLCFSVRSLGYKVMHQPLSVVVHLEGITGGRDVRAGIKKYQEINRPKFVEKWRSVLQDDHYAPDVANVFLARERIAGKKERKTILIVDNKVPDYDRNAGALGMYQYTRLFVDLGFKVIFMPADPRATEPYTRELQQYGVEVMYGRFDFDSWLHRNGKHINYVWLSRPEVAVEYIDRIREKTSAKVLYCGRDLHYLRLLRQHQLEGSEQALQESRRLKQTELMLFHEADAVLTFSTFEADTIAQDLPDKRKIHIVPAYLYDEFLSDCELPCFDDRRDIAFVGGFKHRPNADAVLWFVRECFPRIVAYLPDVKLYVIGDAPPDDIADLQGENIVVTGHVKDLTQCFRTMKLCVAPVRWGAGVKGKIVTSMYYGVPVVTTSLGAEGMGLTDGEHVLIADTPEAFAAKVAELYSDRDMWGKLSKSGLKYVREGYSREAAIGKLLPILDLPECSICGALYKLPEPAAVTNLRETPVCRRCGGLKRRIDLARVLLRVMGSDARCLKEAISDLEKLDTYLLESHGPIHAILSASPRFVCSEYWDDVRRGETRGNVRCEDVQHLTFPDASFDIVISQDVFEHVPDAEAGFREIHRVLKPRGYHIFTVPFNRRSTQSVARARTEGKEVVHLLPAVYHNSSTFFKGWFVFTDFGLDLMEMLRKAGFEVETYEDEHPEYAGGYNIVFACRKT
jgi:O-antigen biosynthesis protein